MHSADGADDPRHRVGMSGAVQRHAGVVEVHALECGGETVRVALAPHLTVGDDVDARALHVPDRHHRRVVLRLLQEVRCDAPDLQGSRPRWEPAAQHRPVDQPVGLRIAPDDGGGQDGRHDQEGIAHHVCALMESRNNRLKGDGCDRDWIWERELETASAEDSFRLAASAWERQFRRLRESSPFYARKFREAGLGSSFVGLADIANIPFTTKTELKDALDDDPPFGTNLCVDPTLVKRVYQTS